MIQRYRLLYEGKDRTFFYQGTTEMLDGEKVKFFRSRDGEYLLPESQIVKLLREQDRAGLE